MDDNLGADPNCPVHLIPYGTGGTPEHPYWICQECGVPALRIEEVQL